MSNVCVKCGADNDDVARFCSQCAWPLIAEAAAETASNAAQPAATKSTGATNWVAIIVIAALVGVIGWLLLSPPKQTTQDAANPHASADMANPHGGMAGGAMGGGDAAGGAMNPAISEQITAAKDALKKNPLDAEALATLYGMYGMIGREKELRPMLDTAADELVKQKAKLGDKAPELLKQLAGAAISGNDAEGAISLLTKYKETEPDNISLLGMLGDVCYDANMPADAVKWYSQYLDKAKPETEGETYWKVRTDRAAMYLATGMQGQAADTDTGLKELQAVTTQYPQLWNAWYLLGEAYKAKGDKKQAETSWNKALELANGELQKWQVQSALAELKGQKPPDPPKNPHGDMSGMGMGGGMENPHGGSAGGGMENPHGGSGGMVNPHGAGGTGT